MAAWIIDSCRTSGVFLVYLLNGISEYFFSFVNWKDGDSKCSTETAFSHIVQFWVAVKRIGPRNLRQADKRWRVTVHRYFFNALLVIYKSASLRPLFKRKWNVPKITGCSLSFSDLWKTLGSNCNIFVIDSYEFSELECSLFTYDALLWNMYSIVKEQRWKQT